MPVKFSDPLYHQGETFLLVSRAEWKQAQNAGKQFAKLKPDYENTDYIIIRCPSAQTIQNAILK